MQMDTEARAVMAQLVAALAPLNHPAPSQAMRHTPDRDRMHDSSYTVGQAKAATTAIVAGNAALAATAPA